MYIWTYILTFDPALHRTSILTFYLSFSLAVYLASILAFSLSSFLASYLECYLDLSGIYSDSLSDIFSDSLFGILSEISDSLSHTYLDSLCGILSDIYFDVVLGKCSERTMLLFGSTRNHYDPGVCCSGPAEATAISLADEAVRRKHQGRKLT